LNARNAAAAAIQALQTASRYDLALGRIGFIGRFGGLYPITTAGWHSSRRISQRRPPPSSSGFSITEASSSSIPWTPWRACRWR
jgi:hypothetical protein